MLLLLHHSFDLELPGKRIKRMGQMRSVCAVPALKLAHARTRANKQ